MGATQEDDLREMALIAEWGDLAPDAYRDVQEACSKLHCLFCGIEAWMGNDLIKIHRLRLWESKTTETSKEAGKYLGRGWEYDLAGHGRYQFSDMNRRIALLQAAVALAKRRAGG